MFHEKCGTLLKRQTTDGKTELYCPTCKENIPRHLLRNNNNLIVAKANDLKYKSALIQDDPNSAPIEHDCEKCGFDKAYELIFPPIRGDEDETIMYKCGRCGNVYRENTKVL